MEKQKYSIGNKFKTLYGYEIEIIEYINPKKRKIKFLHDQTIELVVSLPSIKKGMVKNPYHKSIYGVGCFGIGKYKTKTKGSLIIAYKVWGSMLSRCYSEKGRERLPTYKGATVCKEWHNYQNFAEWYDDNLPKIEGIKFQLDKDLLQSGLENKTYSPDTCVFLPQSVNLFLSNKYSNNTSGYTGVGWYSRDEKWVAHINLFGEDKKRKYLGLFTTSELASEAYQKARAEQAEKAKEYLRSLNYLPEDIIKLIK